MALTHVRCFHPEGNRRRCGWVGDVEDMSQACPKCGNVQCLVVVTKVPLPAGSKLVDGRLVRA